MKKKILLLGSINSIYITEFIENVLFPLGFDIYLFSFYDEYCENKSFLEKYHIRLIRKFVFSKKICFPFLGKFIRLFQRLVQIAVNLNRIKKYGEFDVINLHFVTVDDLILVNLVSSSSEKKIATYWGSDFFRVSKLDLLFKRLFLRKFHVVTTDSLTIYNQLCDKYPYNNIKFEVIHSVATILEIEVI